MSIGLARSLAARAESLYGYRSVSTLARQLRNTGERKPKENSIDLQLEGVSERLKGLKIDQVPENEIKSYIKKRAEAFKDRSFHIVDLRKVVQKTALWNKAFPTVRPYFSVKTNHDPVVLKTLGALGVGFDCSTIEEIQQVSSIIGVNSEKDIIFAHPRKPRSSISESFKLGVRVTVVDSVEELRKIQQLALGFKPDVLIRIKTEDSKSGTPLSVKFGASLEEAQEIIAYAFNNNIKSLAGISFHVGSNNLDSTAYTKAIEDSGRLIEGLNKRFGRQLNILDIGGGWPGGRDEDFMRIAHNVTKTMQQHIPSPIELVAEPGRFLCSDCTTLVSRVLGKKVDFTNKGNKQIAYFINNGVYGFFLSSLYYNHNLKKTLKEGWKFSLLNEDKKEPHLTKLWGPTLDSGDLVADGIQLPELEEGNLILADGMGCYGMVYESEFSQQAHSVPVYIISKPLSKGDHE